VNNSLKQVSFLPFHQLGRSKYPRLSREYLYHHHPNLLTMKQSNALVQAIRIFAHYGLTIQD
jgi:hypothetical protein